MVAPKPSIDAAEALKFEREYLIQLVITGFEENGRVYNYDNAKVYELKDEKKQFPRPLGKVFNRPRPKLVIRYTEIGCNSCADSTFKYIKRYKVLESLYDILVLVDFSNYDAYLKWRKISEVAYPVLWLKKGDLPFKIDSATYSFIFTVSPSLGADNFFIPNSKFPNYIDMYFRILESRNS